MTKRKAQPCNYGLGRGGHAKRATEYQELKMMYPCGLLTCENRTLKLAKQYYKQLPGIARISHKPSPPVSKLSALKADFVRCVSLKTHRTSISSWLDLADSTQLLATNFDCSNTLMSNTNIL